MAEAEEADHPVGVDAQPRVARAEQTRQHGALVLLPGQDKVLADAQFWKYLQQLEGAPDAETIETPAATGP